MQYLLLVRVDNDADPTPGESDPSAWDAAVQSDGSLLLAERLAEPSDATTVRVRDGKMLLTDGPFAEYKEHIGGLALIEAPDLDAAVAIAAQHPVATFGSMEVREVWPFGAGEVDVDAPAGSVTMNYALLMGAVPDAPPAGPDTMPPTDWFEEMRRCGIVHDGARLRPTDEARTVRRRGGEVLCVHGPHAEVQEQVAGFGLIPAADLDEAIEITAGHPGAWLGAVEIRPLWTP